jgi:hypothetical protein
MYCSPCLTPVYIQLYPVSLFSENCENTSIIFFIELGGKIVRRMSFMCVSIAPNHSELESNFKEIHPRPNPYSKN